ncbi:Rdx family protein [Alkalihalobacillus sp. LMS39]|nr:Rdx family protein [Alkalihalobacillus sp. LMS39]UOE96462.1 Rdx family protein [Alkalihalobacillus sp. LMS39]
MTEFSLIPGSGGVFEVTVNGTNVYSKRETGQFPETKAVIEKMESMTE